MKTRPSKFKSSLTPANAAIDGGFGSGGKINPGKWATELFKGEMSGPWLCCYMLRRFGWPNEGSDDYKNLCAWTLTTPMNGLYLSVTPYLGHNGEQPKDLKHAMNLHFGVRFNATIEKNLHRDPPLLADFRKRENAALLKWWRTTGRKLYVFGCTKKDDTEETLVNEWSEDSKTPGMIHGLYKRRKEHGRAKGQDKWLTYPMAHWWLGEFLEKKHTEVRLPKFTKTIRESCNHITRFEIQIRSAVRATLKDLLRPTNVRDISFTPFGDIERTPEAVKRYTNQEGTGYFHGAGHTPEYWFKDATLKERSGESGD